MVTYNRNEEPIVISKILSDKLLRQENPADLMALYWFYYYTAKWQLTNQPKATISYVAKALNWGDQKTRKNKKILQELGLIEDIKRIDKETKKIVGWYVKVNFIWSEDVHPSNKPEGGQSQRVDKSHPNALSAVSKNALSAINKNNNSANQRFAPPGEEYSKSFLEFWEQYPNKKGKRKAFLVWKRRGLHKRKQEILDGLEAQKKSEQWQKENGKFIPHPSTFLNGDRWLDSVEEAVPSYRDLDNE